MGSQTSSLEDRYFLQKVTLGKGSFGVVVRGVDRQTSEVVAVKQIDKSFMRRAGMTQEDVEREVKIMHACDHPNLLRLFGCFDSYQCVSLALEYCDGGDFGDKLKEKASTLQDHEAAEWMKQICGGIHALHSKNICHRDVKPDNFMVAGGVLKLADFGLSTFLQKGQLITVKCGTPAFMAPEIHKLPGGSRGYSFEVDMWAAGLIMFSLLSKARHPFIDHPSGNLNMRPLMEGVLIFSSPNQFQLADFLPWSKPKESEALCRRMVDPNPATRITAQDALKTEWLRQAPDTPQKPKATPRQASSGSKENVPMVGNNVQRDLHKENSALKAQVKDHEAQLEAQRKRELALLEKAGEKNSAAPKTLCARTMASQGRLPAGAKCRYWSFTQQTWMAASVTCFNEHDGTYDLDVRAQVVPTRIAPRSNVRVEEAWPRGTFVTYRSSSSGKDVPAVVFAFEVDAAGVGTYKLDVKDSADVDRIRPR